MNVEEQPRRIIRASAGSGKTYQLSGRYIRLLDGGAPPATILATTFTRKAAGEILERVLQRLAFGAADADGADILSKALKDNRLSLQRNRALLADLCSSLHRVSIGTLDSFFNRVAMCFAYEIDVPPDPILTDESSPIVGQLRALAVDSVLGEEELGVIVDLLRRLHHEADAKVSEAIEQIVVSLYEVYRQSDESAWHAMPVVDDLSTSELAEAFEAFREAQSGVTQKSWAKGMAGDIGRAFNGQWEEFVAKGIPAKIIAAEGDEVCYSTRTPLPSDIIEVYRPLIAHAQASQINYISHRTRAMHDLLTRFDAKFSELRREHGVMLFSDLPIKLARELPELGDGVWEDVYFRLDGRIAHLLLDEFQDTSILQWDVLRPIAQEISSVTDPSQSLRGAERSFFCVGDLKQAIYGWRGGCAEIFDQVIDDLHFPTEWIEPSNTSWRSSPIVLDAVNRVFGGIGECAALESHRESAGQWQGFFDPHQAAREDQPGYVEVRTTAKASAGEDDEHHDEDDGQEQTTPRGHLQFVAAQIQALADAHPARSIGVLVRKNATVNQLLYELRTGGVDASGEGGNPVTDDAAVNVVLSAMQLADHPGDTAAAFHVLHSPLADIVGLDSIMERSRRTCSLSIRQRVAAEGYAAVITDWSRQLAASCDARNIIRLSQLVELADAFEPNLTLRTRDFIAFVTASTVQEPSAARVRVMTVHKSKGLEFDIVVLPEMSAKIGQVRPDSVIVARPSPTDVPDAVFAYANKKLHPLIAEHCPHFVDAYAQEERRRYMDDLCGLYVAMTRARHALHILLPPRELTPKGNERNKGVSDGSAAALIREQLACDDVQEHYEGNQVLCEIGDVDWDAMQGAIHQVAQADSQVAAADDVVASLRESLGGQIGKSKTLKRSWRRVAPSSLEGGGAKVGELLDIEPQVGRSFGSLIHNWCAAVAWLDDGTSQLINDDQWLIDLARDAGFIEEESALLAKASQFRNMLLHDAVRGVFVKPSTGEVELWRERSFAVRIEGDLVTGAFDRVVIHREDNTIERVELIDFKTDGVPDDASLAAAVGRYRPQLAMYRNALAAMLGVDAVNISARLVFVTHGVATVPAFEN